MEGFLLMLRKTTFFLLMLAVSAASLCAQQSRHFTFQYGFAVKNIPADQKVRIWFPLADSSEYQAVRIISANGDLRLKKTRDSKFGNQIYFAETSRSKQPELHFEVVYDVVRHERLVLGTFAPHLGSVQLKERERNQFLAPDELVPVTGLPAELAAKATAGIATPIDKARAIYNYVFDNMSYDKTGTGWGRGDTLYACEAKKGNCTDFHSLFISMTRSQGIPSRFDIGFPLPADKHSGEIAAYHCWADFFEPQHGWVPLDISEAWKHPPMKSYFFGGLDANRVQFTSGRDLRLSPAQDGPLLNYFVYPYVEVGGKPYSNVSMEFSFADSAGASSASQ